MVLPLHVRTEGFYSYCVHFFWEDASQHDDTTQQQQHMMTLFFFTILLPILQFCEMLPQLT